MALRTTAGEVRDILVAGLDYDTIRKPSLNPFLNAATVVVDRVVTCATAKDITLTADEKRIIEAWLAAHFYKMSDQQTSSRSTAGKSGSFRAGGGLNLDGSTYGQTAKMLDVSGCLAALDKRAVASFAWLGKEPSNRTPYEQRN